MPRERNTKTHNIFLLDRSKLQDAFTSGEETPIPELLELLMATDANYHMQSLKDGLNTSGFSVKLFFRGEDNYQSKFASFCKPFVSDGEEAVTFHPRTASSVLFIWNDRHVFAITTGQGYRMIELFAVPKFGYGLYHALCRTRKTDCRFGSRKPRASPQTWHQQPETSQARSRHSSP